ncbi:MAG: putative metallopeptidase [Dehalococcoidia bacterium]
MSSADEVLSLLDGTDAEVIERVKELVDHATLMVSHLAERRGRRRPSVLKAIMERSAEVEAPTVLNVAKIEKAVVEVIGALAFSRPTARELPRDIDDDDLYPVPEPDDFEDKRTGKLWDFMLAPDLEEIGARLVDEYEHLEQARGWKVRYLWKREGGQSHGSDRLGYCRKLSGEAGFFGGHDFVIALGADHMRMYGMTYRQVQAATFHELLHVGTSQNYGPTLNGHDAELFYAEMDVFGQWKRNLRPLQYQPELF